MTKARPPKPLEGPALGRARQFALSRGLPEPQVEGATRNPVPTPAKEAKGRAARKKTRSKPAR
ncbi:hypothetical protein [Piscinibacter sp.]|jgi:hypothetical protein|uniref:hypothetical protein n=1 Tax=Piscinibacter sp. TaxID=1903157 RepID=UPI002F3FCE69